MKYVDEFRDRELAQSLARAIAEAAETDRDYRLMEFCGGHTHAIFRYGIQDLMPDNVSFVHGPGCPVCVLPIGRIDNAIKLAVEDEVILCIYGDLLRVPGSGRTSLMKIKASGGDVRMVYSTSDALEIARAYPEREVVFFALGFETTMPSTALTILAAAREQVRNFSVLCQHITIIPTLKALLEDPSTVIDGFIGPGHVSMVIGNRGYAFIARTHRKPFVVSGFEPLDVLQSLAMVLEQIARGEARVENQYTRIVPEGGNAAALRAIDEVDVERDGCEWRGLGFIERSGVRVREAFAAFDAEQRFGLRPAHVPDPEICQCGEVVRGSLKPHECRAFGTACTPRTPLGALMVSSEGACAAYYQYDALRAAASG